MSRVEKIDLVALRARLLLAIIPGEEIEGSSFLLAIAALALAAEPESPAEQGLWQSLLDAQALEENLNGAEITALLAGVES